jgi:soluble lytic murein transglycosylase-like protein
MNTSAEAPGVERLRWRRVMVAMACACTASAVCADVFEYIDADGLATYSDRPAGPRFRLLFRTPDDAAGALPPAERLLRRQRYEAEIQRAADAHGLEASLLHAVVAVESGYNHRAVSAKGAQGLMQLMPGTARRFGLGEPFDAPSNLDAGARYLRNLLDLFAQDLSLALAAYNAGEGAVISHGRRIPPYRETQRYVAAVLARYRAATTG